MLPFEELLPLLQTHLRPLPVISLPLPEAGMRVLAEPARAAWDLPRFDNSAMDGFAVQASDVAAATQDAPAELDVAGSAYAGATDQPLVSIGTAVAIGTGGMLPAGADAIVPKENAAAFEHHIAVHTPSPPGKHIRRQGEECRAGDTVLAAGTRLDAYAVAALNAAGVQQVSVRRAPRIRIFATGDELVQPPGIPGPGQIVETNGRFLHAALSHLLALEIPAPEVVPDEEAALRSTLNHAMQQADLIITSGGVSVGDRDLLKDLAEELGAERLLWKVAVKPGKPIYLARTDHCIVLGLPGNPAAVGALLPVLVLPLLRLLEGCTVLRPALVVQTGSDIQPNATRTELHWCRLHAEADTNIAEPLPRRGSHMLTDLAAADILLIVPPGPNTIPHGTQLQAIPLPRF